MRHLFDKTLILQRKTRIDDGQGGWIEDWQTVGTIRGRFRPASASERTAAAQEQAVISHVLYCAADEDVCRGDRVVLGNLIVEVTAVREPSYAGHHLECEGVAVQSG
jgi:SPP1 family predicted phage head-tail adaptor